MNSLAGKKVYLKESSPYFGVGSKNPHSESVVGEIVEVQDTNLARVTVLWETGKSEQYHEEDLGFLDFDITKANLYDKVLVNIGNLSAKVPLRELISAYFVIGKSNGVLTVELYGILKKLLLNGESLNNIFKDFYDFPIVGYADVREDFENEIMKQSVVYQKDLKKRSIEEKINSLKGELLDLETELNKLYTKEL